MQRIRTPLVALVCAALLAAGCGKKADKSVAEVGGKSISAGALLIEYSAITAPNRPPFDTLEQKKAFLDLLISKEVLLRDATERGLDKSPAVVSGLLGFEEQQLLKAVFTEKAQKSVTIEPAAIEEYYKKTASEVHLRDIWVGEDKALADAVIKEVRAGGDFAALAKKYSKNDFAAQGGDMGWSPRGDVRIALFNEQIDNLKPGDVSDPIHTPAGYHIVQLVEEKPADMAEFEARKLSVRGELRKKKENQAWQAYVTQLREGSHLATPAENIALVSGRSAQTPMGEVMQFSDQEKALPLVTYDGGTWTIGDFLFYLQSAGPSFRPNFADSAFDASAWMQSRALSRVLLKSAHDLGLDKAQDFVSRLGRKREELMLEELHKEIVKDVVVTEAEMRTYYEAHSESLRAPAGATIRLIMTSNQARIDSAYAEVVAGKSFTDVVERYSEDVNTASTGGLVDTITAGSTGRPDMDEAIFALAPGQTTKPFTLNPTAQFIFKMERRWDGRTLTFEETKASIEGALRVEKQDKVFEGWVVERKKALNVKVNDDALNAIIAEETGSGA